MFKSYAKSIVLPEIRFEHIYFFKASLRLSLHLVFTAFEFFLSRSKTPDLFISLYKYKAALHHKNVSSASVNEEQ